tara:strand:- start:473 stop:745 length:273 start_codon:yes stop_codon:yes gene_type:complete
MKNFIKIIALVWISMFLSLEIKSETWPEKDCKDYSNLIAVLTVASGETLELSDKASKAEKKEEAEELFEASFAFSQMAANHTIVYKQFCD